MARPQYNPPPRAWHLEVAMALREDNVIETVTGDRSPHYEPFGWHHWPEHPWLSYQFRRGLGETPGGRRRYGVLASRVAGRGRPKFCARRGRGGAWPPAHRDELLAARRRLLPPGRGFPGRGRSAA